VFVCNVTRYITDECRWLVMSFRVSNNLDDGSHRRPTDDVDVLWCGPSTERCTAAHVIPQTVWSRRRRLVVWSVYRAVYSRSRHTSDSLESTSTSCGVDRLQSCVQPLTLYLRQSGVDVDVLWRGASTELCTAAHVIPQRVWSRRRRLVVWTVYRAVYSRSRHTSESLESTSTSCGVNRLQSCVQPLTSYVRESGVDVDVLWCGASTELCTAAHVIPQTVWSRRTARTVPDLLT